MRYMNRKYGTETEQGNLRVQKAPVGVAYIRSKDGNDGDGGKRNMLQGYVRSDEDICETAGGIESADLDEDISDAVREIENADRIQMDGRELEAWGLSIVTARGKYAVTTTMQIYGVCDAGLESCPGACVFLRMS
ncbi:hypothetical protein H4582DRAFT_2066359 [Lactarius indigo]|nr:hypothetical protein H4582DRAFT_2066359 [Lactarius indigo]